MSLIDLGFTYDEAKEESKSSFSDLPDGVYTTQVVKWEKRDSAAGNPYLLFHLQILNNPELQNRRLFYRVMLDGSAIGKRRMIELVNGCGASWTGSQFDPETLMGLTVSAKQVTKDGNANNYIVK